MKQTLLSVIMPVYNEKNRVQRAIESVRNQTFCDWELICVDDASSDGTQNILKQIAQTDERIRIIFLEQNGGQGRARNIGMNYSKGKYTFFLDADDYIKENCFMTLYDLAEKTECDEIYFGVQHNFEESLSKTNYTENQYFGKDTMYSCYNEGAEFLYDMIKNNALRLAVWRQFFLTDFLKENNIRYPENMCMEDVPFSVKAILNCSKLCYLRKELYVYCVRPDSTTTSKVSAYTLFSSFNVFKIFFELWYEEKGAISLKLKVLEYLYQHFLYYSKNLYMRLSLEERLIAQEKIVVDAHSAGLFRTFIKEQERGAFISQISQEHVRMIKSYPEIIIYGAGNYAVDLYTLLKQRFINVLGFAITKYGSDVSEIDEKPVLIIEEWAEYKESALIIIGTSSSSREKIKLNLDKMGFQNVMSLWER